MEMEDIFFIQAVPTRGDIFWISLKRKKFPGDACKVVAACLLLLQNSKLNIFVVSFVDCPTAQVEIFRFKYPAHSLPALNAE